MITTSSQTLKRSVNTMSTTEINYFIKYSKLFVDNNNTQVLKLFKYIVKFETITNSKMSEAIEVTSPNQLAVVKNKLYHQILKCLSVYHEKSIADLKYSNRINDVIVLKNKGLMEEAYRECKLLDKQLLAANQYLERYRLSFYTSQIIKFVPFPNSRDLVKIESEHSDQVFASIHQYHQYCMINSKLTEIHYSGKYKDLVNKKEATRLMNLPIMKEVSLSSLPKNKFLFWGIHLLHNNNIHNYDAAFKSAKECYNLLSEIAENNEIDERKEQQVVTNMISIAFNEPKHLIEALHYVDKFIRKKFSLAIRKEINASSVKHIKSIQLLNFIGMIWLHNLNCAILSNDLRHAEEIEKSCLSIFKQCEGMLELYLLQIFRLTQMKLHFRAQNYNHVLYLAAQYMTSTDNLRHRGNSITVMLFEIISLYEMKQAHDLGNYLQKLYRYIKKKDTTEGIEKEVQNFISSLRNKCHQPDLMNKQFKKTLGILKTKSKLPEIKAELKIFDFIEYLELKLGVRKSPKVIHLKQIEWC